MKKAGLILVFFSIALCAQQKKLLRQNSNDSLAVSNAQSFLFHAKKNWADAAFRKQSSSDILRNSNDLIRNTYNFNALIKSSHNAGNGGIFPLQYDNSVHNGLQNLMSLPVYQLK